MTRILVAATLAGLCLLACPVGVRACPSQVPTGLRAVAVASNAVVGGLSMAIHQVQGPGTAGAVLDRVGKQWKEGGFDVRRSHALGWDTVSALGNKCLVTLQLVNRDGVFGYLARSTAPTSAPLTAARLGVPLPPDAKVEGQMSDVWINHRLRKSPSPTELAEYQAAQEGGEVKKVYAITDAKGVTTTHSIIDLRPGDKDVKVGNPWDPKQAI